MKTKLYFPLFVDLSDKKIVVAGGGTIAERRVKTLLPFSESMTVIAPSCTKELQRLEEKGLILLRKRSVEAADFAGADMVLAATDDNMVNDEIYRLCKDAGILVNVCSDRKKCDFYFPGVVQKENIVVGVTASGANHRMAKQVREAIACAVDKMTGENENG